MKVELLDFEKLELPTAGKTYAANSFDMRLRARAASVDAGTPLANLGGPPTGRMPDVGCYERGQPLPSYGPRPLASSPQ